MDKIISVEEFINNKDLHTDYIYLDKEYMSLIEEISFKELKDKYRHCQGRYIIYPDKKLFVVRTYRFY